MTNDRLGGGSGGAKPPQPKFGGSGGQRPPAKNILEYFGIYLFWNLLGETVSRGFDFLRQAHESTDSVKVIPVPDAAPTDREHDDAILTRKASGTPGS